MEDRDRWKKGTRWYWQCSCYLPAGEDSNELQAALKLSVAGPSVRPAQAWWISEFLWQSSLTDAGPSNELQLHKCVTLSRFKMKLCHVWRCLSVLNSVWFSPKTHAWFLFFGGFCWLVVFLCLCILGWLNSQKHLVKNWCLIILSCDVCRLTLLQRC